MMVLRLTLKMLLTLVLLLLMMVLLLLLLLLLLSNPHLMMTLVVMVLMLVTTLSVIHGVPGVALGYACLACLLLSGTYANFMRVVVFYAQCFEEK